MNTERELSALYASPPPQGISKLGLSNLYIEKASAFRR